MRENICATIITFNPDVAKLKMQIQRLLPQVKFVVLIDNDSVNFGEITFVLSDIKNSSLIIIKNDYNIGLGAAQNKGIKHAFILDVSYILLLDDDSLIEDDFVSNLLKVQKELEMNGEKIGAVGPVYFNNETGEQYPVTKYKGPFIERKTPKNSPCEASFLISSGSLISTEILKEVGLMNEELFIDYIDVEWSFRARRKGYKSFVTPTAKMNHVIGEKRLSIFGRKVSYHSSLRKYYLFRNSIYMIKCPYISIGYKIREIVFNALRFVVYLCYSKNKKTFIKYSIRGLYDGLKGKMGECEYQY